MEGNTRTVVGCWVLGVGVLLVPLILNMLFNQEFRKHDCRIKIIISSSFITDAAALKS